VLRAADLDQFRTSVSHFLTPHQLTPLARDGAAVRSDVAVAPLGPVSLVYGHHQGSELGAKLSDESRAGRQSLVIVMKCST
jgi:hypothetical protein